MKPSRGFTLIELLVVIAIIGLLSSIVLSSLNSARERAENAKRVSDIREIQKALELYATANRGNYPSVSSSPTIYHSCTNSNWSSLQTALAPYMQTVPRDPNEDCGPDRQYYVISNGQDYKVMAHVPPNPSKLPRSLWDPLRDSGTNDTVVDGTGPWALSVYTAGGAGF